MYIIDGQTHGHSIIDVPTLDQALHLTETGGTRVCGALISYPEWKLISLSS